MIALAASHDLLAAREWQGVDLAQLARSQLAHLTPLFESRVHLSGPKLVIKPAAGQILGMAIHELATNALKHGALQDASGTVTLNWQVVAPAEDPAATGRFRMRWEERDGPPVAASDRRGFGRTVTVDMVAYQLHAIVATEVRPTGLNWEIETEAQHIVLDRGDIMP